MKEQFEVKDGSRTLSFSGRELASISSRRVGKSRWIELTLYQTAAGTYILQGIGASIVPGEVKREWAQVSDDPSGIIERLYMHNDQGARYIPTTSRMLLQQASERDRRFAAAYLTEHID